MVLKPYAGKNSDYFIIHTGTKEMGLVEACTNKPFEANTNTYCFDRGFNQDEHESTVAVICAQPKTCIRTCCPGGQYLSDNGVCTEYKVEPPEKWTVQFTDDPQATYTSSYKSYNIPCSNGYHQNETEHDWYFESNGDLILDLAPYTYAQYCLNYVEENPGQYTKAIWVCQDENEACHGPFKSWQCAVDFTLLPILMGLSLAFLILLQWVIWSEKKDKLYECLQLCNIWMLALVYLTLIILKTTPLQGALCEILGLVFHFAYMSAFFWLSSMSFFIWRAFNAQGNPADLVRRKFGFFNPQFKFYALYAFGCPGLVILITIILQYLPDEYQENYIAPRINRGHCLLGKAGQGLDIPQLWYFHLINIFTLVSILAFFGIFLWKLAFGNQTQIAATEKERAQRRKQRMKVAVKMFFVMGLTWIADMISWAIATNHGEFEVFKNKGLLYSGLVFQIINSSQGIIMFLVVYFDTNRIRALKRKYNQFTNGAPTTNDAEEDPATRDSQVSGVSGSSSLNTNGFQMKEISMKH